MPRCTYFYATAGDFIQLMRPVEAEAAFSYVWLANEETPALERRSSAADIPDLLRGFPRHFTQTLCLVPCGAVLMPECRETSRGPRYFLYPKDVDAAVVFQLQGAREGGALLRSRWWVHGDAEHAVALGRVIARHMRREFRNLRGPKLGPEAFAVLQAGGRLTFDVNAPPEQDLRLV